MHIINFKCTQGRKKVGLKISAFDIIFFSPFILLSNFGGENFWKICMAK
jgi:hypothetical protein